MSAKTTIKLGRIYKRISGVLEGYPGYIVLTSVDNIVAGHKKYVYVDVESGNESDVIMYEYIVRDYYRLVDDEWQGIAHIANTANPAYCEPCLYRL